MTRTCLNCADELNAGPLLPDKIGIFDATCRWWNIMEVFSILIATLLIYTWIGYPALVIFLARKSRQRVSHESLSDSTVSVAVLVAAHNEESVIADRLSNLAQVCDGAGNVDIWVGDDCSDDATCAIVEKWAATHHAVHLVRGGQRVGKCAVLKRLVVASGATCNTILVFTDANTKFAPDALRKLLAPFADPAIGGVCGRLIFTSSTGDPSPETAYWRMETRLKMAESAIDSCLGGNGAIYAIRATLFWRDIPDTVIVDDFVIGMKVRERGYRMVYEHAAIATEDLPHIDDEWGRRVRIGAGDYQALVLCRGALSPRYGWFAWTFWSHKILRWFTPHLLIALGALSTAQCASNSPGDWRAHFVAWGWGGAIAATALAFVSRRARGFAGRASRGWLHFITMQIALFTGFIRFCRGSLEGTWERTDRTGGIVKSDE